MMVAPKMFLMVFIHAPDLGKRAIADEKVPRTKKGKPMPKENANMSMQPKKIFSVLVTRVRIKPSTGPVQGAANNPATNPIKKAPLKPWPPIDVNRFKNAADNVSEKNPSIDKASTAKKIAMKTRTAGCCIKEPSNIPKDANKMPSTA